MKKNLNLVVIIAMVALVVLVIVAVAVIQNISYSNKSKDLNAQITALNTQVKTLTDAKDTNGFSPTDVSKAFLLEVKNGNNDKAKLYLDASVQNMDTKATMKLGDDVSNLTMGDGSEQIDGDTAAVVLNITVGDNTTAREFDLVKVEGVWKIKGVVAE